MPRTKKAAGQVADRRNGRKHELTAVAGARLELPERTDGGTWHPAALAAWERYWADPVTAAVTPTDEVLVQRWIDALHRYLVLTAAGDRSPLVEGSQGQDVMNPAYKVAELALRTVEACEKQLGIGPAHRASLGIAILTERRTLGAMNAAYTLPEGVDDDDDPRAIGG